MYYHCGCGRGNEDQMRTRILLLFLAIGVILISACTASTATLPPAEAPTQDAPAPTLTPAPTPPPCKADFIAEPTTGEGATVVQFIDQSIGETISWVWDLNGDGIIDSTKQNPSYTYTRDGLYSVTLTITGLSCEDTLTKTNYIQISTSI